MVRPKTNTENRKREILESFYTVLTEKGLEGASIAKIAQRMGIHPSLIIHYFSNKEEMIIELVDYILQLYEDTFLPGLEAIEDPEKRIDASIGTLFGSDWNALIDLSAFYACYGLTFRNARARERFKKMYSTFREILIDELRGFLGRDAVAAGEPERLADLIITLVEGYGYYRNVIDDEDRFAELGRYLAEFTLSAIKANL